jgi:signal transduction histidine kinase
MTPLSPADEIASLEARLAEALKFLGHDAREGHSSTLALLELQRIKPDPMSPAQLAERVETNARKSLATIDDFTDLARARSQPLRLEELDLVDLLVEVVADAWPIASRGGIRIQVAEHPEAMMGWADRELLAGALAKLLRDAVSKAVRGADIGCTLREDTQGWEFEIDAPAESAAALPAEPDPKEARRAALQPSAGVLLGRAVAERHGGAVKVDPPAEGRGSLRLRLPARAGPF